MADIGEMFPGHRSEKQRAAVRENGQLGGRPKDPDHVLDSPAEQEALVNRAAAAVLSGKGINRQLARLGTFTEDDRRAVARCVGMSAEEFTARLTEKLRALTDKTAERIMEHLEAGNNKLSDLSFLLTVGVDKLDRLNGKQAVANSVNVQINNFGPISREEVLARLTGQPIDLPKPEPKPAEQVSAEAEG